jgi:hypothetical protein
MLLLCIRGCEVNATDRAFVGRHGGDVRGSWRGRLCEAFYRARVNDTNMSSHFKIKQYNSMKI